MRCSGDLEVFLSFPHSGNHYCFTHIAFLTHSFLPTGRPLNIDIGLVVNPSSADDLEKQKSFIVSLLKSHSVKPDVTQIGVINAMTGHITLTLERVGNTAKIMNSVDNLYYTDDKKDLSSITVEGLRTFFSPLKGGRQYSKKILLVFVEANVNVTHGFDMKMISLEKGKIYIGYVIANQTKGPDQIIREQVKKGKCSEDGHVFF